jgi:hypothetical protein
MQLCHSAALRSNGAVTVIVKEAPSRFGVFSSRLEGADRYLVPSSRSPFFDAARRLLDLGHAPTVLVMRHEGSSTESLRTTIGDAARLSVTDSRHGTPVLRPFRKAQPGVVAAPPTRQTGEAVH